MPIATSVDRSRLPCASVSNLVGITVRHAGLVEDRQRVVQALQPLRFGRQAMKLRSRAGISNRSLNTWQRDASTSSSSTMRRAMLNTMPACRS